mmetsp:Transcript_168246/g.298095  ORF Transcript_168246/g.298095 Transcript_168246/m.298095 type:complete len:319 (+) Transcript_168246:30-986(+)
MHTVLHHCLPSLLCNLQVRRSPHFSQSAHGAAGCEAAFLEAPNCCHHNARNAGLWRTQICSSWRNTPATPSVALCSFGGRHASKAHSICSQLLRFPAIPQLVVLLATSKLLNLKLKIWAVIVHRLKDTQTIRVMATVTRGLAESLYALQHIIYGNITVADQLHRMFVNRVNKICKATRLVVLLQGEPWNAMDEDCMILQGQAQVVFSTVRLAAEVVEMEAGKAIPAQRHFHQSAPRDLHASRNQLRHTTSLICQCSTQSALHVTSLEDHRRCLLCLDGHAKILTEHFLTIVGTVDENDLKAVAQVLHERWNVPISMKA